MVQQCGLNFLLQYAPWLAKLLAIARQRPEILDALRGLRQIAYTGAALNPADERWALDQGIPLTVCYFPRVVILLLTLALLQHSLCMPILNAVRG